MDKKASDAEKLVSISEPQSSAADWPRYAAIALAVYVFLGGLISFLAYPFNIPRLTDWNNDGISIQANTSVAVMATGLVILLVHFGYRKLPIVLSGLVAFLGATSIFQLATEIDLGFNTFLMFGHLWGQGGVILPGLMGTPGATSWTLLGTALLLVSIFTEADRHKDFLQARFAAVTLALIAMIVSSLSLIGYLYGAAALYTLPRLTIIALQTATFILCSSLAIILSIRESGPMRLFADTGQAGILARRIIPAIILLPLVIGAIRLAGERAGFYDTAFGSAIRTLIEIALLLTILWWAGTALSKHARAAKEHQQTLQQLADAMPQVVWIADESGTVHYYNDRVDNFGGITRMTTSLFDWQPGLHPEDLESTIKTWNAAVVNGQVYEQEHRILMADGTYRWHLSRAVPLVDADGKTRRWYGTATDIHDRKSAELTLRESEQRFARFMHHLPGLSWIKDSYGKYVYANDAAQKAFQTEMPQLYGKSDDDIFPPATAAAFKVNDQRALDSAAGLQTVETLRGDDGILKFSLVSKFPIPAANGSRPMVGGMAIDITEQKHAEANREFLFKVSEMVRTARVAEDLVADIAAALGKYLEIHRCLFNEIDLETDIEIVHGDYSRDGDHIQGKHRISDYSSISSAQMQAGLTVVNRDSETDPRTAEFFEKTYKPNKELAYIAVPMMRGGKWVASLWCSDDKPRDWTDQEIALIENIAERSWLAVERLRSENITARLAAIVSSSEDAIVSKDLNSIIMSWNHGAEKVFGYKEDEVIGKPVTILMPPDRVDEEPEILARIRSGESIDHYETVRQRKDGSLLNVSLTVSPIFDVQGTIIGASKIARDITERKLVEAKIEMISRMPEENPNPVMRISSKGEILYSNDAAQPLIDFWKRSYQKGLSTEFEEQVYEALESGTKQRIEVPFDGRILSCTLAPIVEAGYVNVYADDITEQRRAQSELNRRSQLIELSFEPIFVWEFEKGIIEWNKGAEQLYGFTRDEALGQRGDELLKTQHSMPANEFRKLLIEQGGWTGELRHTTKDGREVLIRSRQQLAEIDGRTYVLETNRDITKQRIAEDSLRLSEIRYRDLFDSMDEGYCIIEVIFDGRGKAVDYLFIEVNRAFEHQAGMHDVVGKRMLEFVTDIEPHWLLNYGKVARSGNPVRFAGEYKGLNKSFEVYAFKIGDKDSRRIAVLFTDITARKKAADALQQAEARSKLAQETGGVGIWDWDAATELTYWSDTMWSLYGEEVQENMPNNEFWLSHLYPDDRDRAQKNIETALSSNRTNYRDEFRIIRKNDEERWVESIATIVRDERGKPLRMYGVNIDLTEKKLVEQRIKASETQLRLVTNTIPALVSYIDKRERYQFVNRQYSEWFQKPQEQFIGKKLKDVVGTRAYQVFKPYIDEVLSGNEVSFDSWVHYKSAGERFVHISYVPDIGPASSVLGFYALVSDLSDLRRSADLLRSSQERMRLLTESFTDYAIISTDPDGKVESWNPGATTIFGYEENEIIGLSADILFTPDDVRKGTPLKEMREARLYGRASDERWHLRKDGSRFFASGVMVPLYVGKTLTGYAKIAADLTERKRNAEVLQRAHDEMEMRVLERTRELAETNAALVAEINERQAAEEQKIDLLKKLVTTQEDERRRIARDLHDQLGQRLTALRLKIASLREVVGHDEELRERTTRLQEIAELLDSEVSFLAWELRPSAIEELGLVDAIGTFVREWSRHNGIEADFHATGMANFELDPEADTHLYRIAQEALNNIVKHAEAAKVTVLVERMGDEVVLIVEDDGKGFDRTQKRIKKTSKGLGLTGMGERASLIGGDVEIESAPGSGTTIFARVPVLKTKQNKKV